ncbi:hypothetical protein AAFC00_004939, partial [Neodothiora populina]
MESNPFGDERATSSAHSSDTAVDADSPVNPETHPARSDQATTATQSGGVQEDATQTDNAQAKTTTHTDETQTNFTSNPNEEQANSSQSQSQEAQPSRSKVDLTLELPRPFVNRSTTFPPPLSGGAPNEAENENKEETATRRRGATLSSVRHSMEPGDRLDAIHENHAMNNAQAETGSVKSSSMGSRVAGGRSASGISRRRTRGFTLNRAPTSLVRRPTAIASGRAPSMISDQEIPGGFTLAGPDIQAAQNQPYIDPAYAALNPAYVQPTNNRPVWGLAKPLPRVLRPGMVPTPSELNLSGPGESGQQQQQQQQPAESSASQWDVDDIEKGKPSLRRAGTFQAVSDLTAQREARLLRRGTITSDARTSVDEQGGRSNNGVEPFPSFPQSFPQAMPTPIQETEEEGPNYFERMNSQPYSFNQSARRPTITRFDDNVSEADTAMENDEEWPALTPYDIKMGNPDDEIHNHHTHWSIIRTRYREPLAEFLGALVQLTIAFCADLSVTVSNNPNNFSASYAWGFASMTGIYIAGGISGAHLNPAISLLLWVYRGFPLRKVPAYIFAQVLAAFLAGLIAFGLYRSAIIEYAAGLNLGASGTADSFITSRRHGTVDAATAFFNEFVATAFLAVAVLAMGDDSNAPPGAGMSALVLGLVITVLCMAFGYNTGAAMNPSRDFGPRLALLAVGYGGHLFRNGYWVYGPWVATILGALVGGGMYDIAIFVGGESPINYPRKRIWRAGHKFKKRMHKRLRREEIPDA